MSLLTFAQVVTRYGFGTSITWAEELLRYQICFVAFFGADIGLKHGSHIKAEILNLFMPPCVKHFVGAFVLLVVASFCFIFAYYGTLLVLKVAAGAQVTAALQIPKFYVYLPIPIGGYIMCVRSIYNFAGEIRKTHLCAKNNK